MMVQFWLGAILFIVIACILFLQPFLAQKKYDSSDSDDKRDRLNKALYDVRILELESDEQQGALLEKESLIKELQYNLLDDISVQHAPLISHSHKLLYLPGLALLIFGTFSLYWSVGGYQQVNDWQNTLQRYPELQSQLFNASSTRPSEQDLRSIMLGLRTQLVHTPTDANAWFIYSRLSMAFNENKQALAAIEKAYALTPNNVDVALLYAQLILQQNDASGRQQAQLMLEKILLAHPKIAQAWSMYAFVAFENKNYVDAIHRWEKMLLLDAISAQQATILRDSIRYAEKKLTALDNKNMTEDDIGK